VGCGAQRKVATKKQLNLLAGQVAKWFETNKTSLLSIMKVILAHLLFK
jgi:hypothetical protein